MHEYALADAVVASVKQEIQKENATTVASVVISLGELQNINKEVFLEGLRNALTDDDFDESVFHFEEEKAVFLCNYCHAEWTLDSFPDLTEDDKEAIHFLPESAHVYLSCPQCNSRDFSVQTGRGVHISSIELLKETS